MRRMMPLGRRQVLAGLTLACASPALASTAEAQPGTLIVAGPPGGRLDHWAEAFAPVISRGMPGRSPVVWRNVGGNDGVTGANQFEARGEPDGSTALLVPGMAAVSWLTGEARAHFDPARWVPLWAGTDSAVLVSRTVLTPGVKLRVGAAGPAGPELPALLALDLLGIDVALCPAASADAVLLQGGGLPAALAAAAQSGMQPVMTLGAVGIDGLGRDPMLPTVPTALEMVQGRAPADMLAALQAAGTAVMLDAGLVLPALTPAGAVALWRRACVSLQQDPEVLREAVRLGTRLIPADVVASCTSGIAGSPATLLALRSWLATRYGWRPA